MPNLWPGQSADLWLSDEEGVQGHRPSSLRLPTNLSTYLAASEQGHSLLRAQDFGREGFASIVRNELDEASWFLIHVGSEVWSTIAHSCH